MQNRLQNPFPNPDLVDPEINAEIKEYIKSIFASGSQLTFHDISQYFEKCITDKDIPRAKISAYYCTNVILSTPRFTDANKSELIASMIREINGIIFDK